VSRSNNAGRNRYPALACTSCALEPIRLNRIAPDKLCNSLRAISLSGGA